MKIKIITFLMCLTVCVSGQTLNNQVDSLSYAFGAFFGRNIQSSVQSGGFPTVNARVLVQAIQTLFENEAELKMTPEEASMYINVQYAKLLEARYEGNRTAGLRFLENNRTAPEVVTLPSGLQYKVITPGDGPKPTAADQVTVHYHGTLIDGTVFDSSVERGQPAVFGVTQVIQGWVEALQLMPVGSKWILYIPSELAYGNTQRPGGVIEPYSTLIFEVELISINN